MHNFENFFGTVQTDITAQAEPQRVSGKRQSARKKQEQKERRQRRTQTQRAPPADTTGTGGRGSHAWRPHTSPCPKCDVGHLASSELSAAEKRQAHAARHRTIQCDGCLKDMAQTKGSVVMYSCSQGNRDVDLCIIYYCNEEHRTALRPPAPPETTPDVLLQGSRAWTGEVYRQGLLLRSVKGKQDALLFLLSFFLSLSSSFSLRSHTSFPRRCTEGVLSRCWCQFTY